MTMTDTKTTSSEIYRQQGMGQRIGFGQRPAVLVIDMQHDFCDPERTHDPVAVDRRDL